MASERTNQLLDRVVKPGEHKLEFYARWGTEIEMGKFTSNAARFWSKYNRRDLLRPCMSMEEALEEWDEEEHGERPEEGGPEWLEDDALIGDECRFIYINAEMVLPDETFFAEPLPAPREGEREGERRTIPLAEFLSLTDMAQIQRVKESEMYPDPAPSCWHCVNGWKGNAGECSITVDKAVTLRELLRAQPLCAEMWVNGSEHHVANIIIGDEDNHVEWDNGSGKSTEFEVEPPDNMRLWRLAATAIGRFMQLLRRASDRAYAPGGVGEEHARREFEKLAAAPRQVE